MRALACALTALVLGGCAAMKPTEVPDHAAWEARRAELAPVTDFQLEGRISIAAGRDGWSGSLNWIQQGPALDFRFRGPFGLGGLRIHGDAESLEVQTHKGERFLVRDPERELTARLGWSVPIHAMRNWLLGVPTPDVPFDVRVDGRGRAARIEQDHWRVSYDEYMWTEHRELPRRFVIERDAVKVKVVVDRWLLAAAPADVAQQ